MNINVISSGSKGNCAIISHGNNKLLLDAGISLDKICRALNYDLTGLDGCLISHEHQDHSKAIPDLLKLSIDCYMSEGTFKALKLADYNTYIPAYLPVLCISLVADPTLQIDNRGILKLNQWLILPIALIHDAMEPLGFLLSIGNECLLYAIDTAYIPDLIEGENGLTDFYDLNRLTHIMIECNYSLDIVREKTQAKELPVIMKNRLLKSHMSLETCKKFLQANDLSHVKEIWLLHISERHGNKKFFKDVIQKLTGKIVKTI